MTPQKIDLLRQFRLVLAADDDDLAAEVVGALDAALEALDAVAAYRRHIYECEDCANEESCEPGFDLWDTMLEKIDVVAGSPRAETEAA